MTQAFEGIRVLDFTQLEQGPSGTQVLADFGADVIKVERPGTGEIGRRQAPTLDGGFSPHWSACNRNKRSITVDVKHPDGLALLLDLARDADIVASNFRPGVMDRLGLGYDALSSTNPRIIVAYASGYGQTGPYAQRRGQDLAAQAIGGLMSLTGTADGPPTPTGTFMIDYLASMQFAQGMMIALAARERTGRGQVVDSCLLNAAVACHLQEAASHLNTGLRFDRPAAGVAHAHNTALYGYYEAGDGTWFVLIGEFYVTEPWQRTARALDLPDHVVHDERFQTNQGLLDHVEETTRLVREAALRSPRAHLMSRFEAEDVLVAPVNSHDDVFTDPQVLHNEMLVEMDVDGVGTARVVGVPVKLSATPGGLHRVPPALGQHNDEVLNDAGLSDARIAALRASGAIGDESERQHRTGVATW